MTSASELASIEAAAVRAYDAVPDPRLERALRSFLEASACVESSESSTEYVPALHGRLLHRARARTEATGTFADAQCSAMYHVGTCFGCSQIVGHTKTPILVAVPIDFDIASFHTRIGNDFVLDESE